MVQQKEKVFLYYRSPFSFSKGIQCEYKACSKEGIHKALTQADAPHSKILLCDDHIKVHNEKMNYFAGMSIEEIEKQIRADSTWRRPSWPLGVQSEKLSAYFKKPFDMDYPFKQNRFGQQAEPKKIPENIQEALTFLELDLPCSLDKLKKSYKSKVKKYHPDVNKGSKSAEETFKQVHAAYKLLLDYIQPLAEK